MDTHLLDNESAIDCDSLIAGRFSIESRLGAGATGIVYVGKDSALDGKAVAIKILYPHLLEQENSLIQFKQEVLITQRLSHPCIVQTHGFFQDTNGLVILVMELVDGYSLRDLLVLQPEGLSRPSLLNVLYGVASAVTYAHSFGILHRDLKPDNVLAEQDLGLVKVADFGLAASLDRRIGAEDHRELVGTPAYMPPEIFLGSCWEPVSDVYSFGIMAFELIAGKRPFDGHTLFELAEAHRSQPLPTIDTHRVSSYGEWLVQLITSCCNKEPCKRPTMEQILDVLEKNASSEIEQTKRLLGLDTNISNRLTTNFGENLSDEPIRARPFLWMALVLSTCFLCLFIIAPRIFPTVQWRTAKLVAIVENHSGVRLPLVYKLMGVDVDVHDPTTIETVSRVTSIVPFYAGVSPNIRGADGEYPIHRALKKTVTESFRRQVLNTLFAFNADPNVRDSDGRTPLSIAVEAQDVNAVDLLLAKGADDSLADSQGRTPLHFAARHTRLDILFALLRANSSTMVRDSSNRTPLHEAICFPKQVEIMLKHSSFTAAPKLQQRVLLGELRANIASCYDQLGVRGQIEGILKQAETTLSEDSQAH